MESANVVGQDESKVVFTRCTCAETAADGLMSRCFITGDQCPHKKSIIAKRIKRHEEDKIKAFVVMSFTPVTDALYQWMLKDLITSSLQGDETGQTAFYLGDKPIKPDNVDIVRCDDSVYNSHIICESICSAIQESDLVVVDLSYDNPNVFYEFGLAVALGKRILPICYRNAYYKSNGGEQKSIDTFKWKKQLLELFSINTREGKKEYTDIGYFKSFPFSGPDENRRIGVNLRRVLNHSLQKTDNVLLYDPRQSSFQQAGSAIPRVINSFDAIVDKVAKGILEKGNPAAKREDPAEEGGGGGEKAVCPEARGMLSRGDRIMLLYSDEQIRSENKDRKDNPVEYDFGDVCRIAINQANYSIESNEQSAGSRGLERSMWNYIYNCTEAQSFAYPIFIDTIKERRFPDLDFLLEDRLALDEDSPWSFTYLDVILAKARHCHTALIDMRKNAIEALFWMGIFHGRGRFVIPIRYDDGKANAASEANGRIIADIAGLWNAYFQSKAPEAFSETVKKVLKGINQKSGHLDAWQKTQFLRTIGAWTYYPGLSDKEKKDVAPCDMDALEQYYREACWNVLLAHGDVSLCPASYKAEGKATVSHWDYNAIAQLENFTNQRIGAFRTVLQDTLGPNSRKAGRTRYPKIVFGDRDVNDVTEDEIKEAGGQVFQLRKCDVAYERQEYSSEETWRQCYKLGCDLCLTEEGPCAKPVVKSMRGFVKGEDAQWMSDFVSGRVLEDSSRLEGMDRGRLHGQVVFLRHTENQFSILLEGTSGPATYALADLLGANIIVTEEVNRRREEAKKRRGSEAPEKAEAAGEAEACRETKKGFRKDELFFYMLQETMLLRCKDKLEEIRKEVQADSRTQYRDEYFAPAANYLMLCLCERFLPTASQRFVHDLNTRMYLFLKQLEQAARKDSAPSFSPIFEIFRLWFEWFGAVRGIAVILEVRIKWEQDSKYWDNRWPCRVRIAMGEDGSGGTDTRCFSIIE